MKYCPLCGYEIPNEPNESVLRWTRYDGTMETLPEEDKAISVEGIPAYRLENCFMFAVNLSVGGWQFVGRKIEIGDMWVYLPTPETVIES